VDRKRKTYGKTKTRRHEQMQGKYTRRRQKGGAIAFEIDRSREERGGNKNNTKQKARRHLKDEAIPSFLINWLNNYFLVLMWRGYFLSLSVWTPFLSRLVSVWKFLDGSI